MKKPMAFQIHLTNACNQRCLHCYQGFDKRTDLTMEQFDYILAETLKYMESRERLPGRAIFCGGEPTLSPLLLECVKKCRNAGFKEISLLTNGKLITNEFAEKLVRAGVNYAQICIEGNQETHNLIRDGSWNQVLKAWEICSKNGMHVKNQTTINSLNYKEVDDIINTCWGRVQYTTFLRQIPNDLKVSQWLEVLAKIFYDYLHYGQDYINFVQVRDIHWSHIFHNIDYRCGLTDDKLHAVIIESNGDLYPCRRANIAVGNIFKESLAEIETNSLVYQRVRQSKQKDLINSQCGDCDRFKGDCGGGCRAMAFAIKGSLAAEDPQCLIKELDKSFWTDLLKLKTSYSLPNIVKSSKKIPLTTAEVVDYMRLNGTFELALKDVLRRKITALAAEQQGITVSTQEVQNAADTFRIAYGLHNGADFLKWLKEIDISLEVFETYLETNFLNNKFIDKLQEGLEPSEYFKSSESSQVLQDVVYNEWLNKNAKM